MGDGWFHTGDAAVVHPDGYVEIRDRLKDVIISGGENISSVEVEGTLLRHPAVQEVAIVGLPHEKWGEAPHAFVVLRDGGSATEEEMIAFTRDRLAHFKAPHGVTFVDELPKTATGKIQKYVLRERRAEPRPPVGARGPPALGWSRRPQAGGGRAAAADGSGQAMAGEGTARRGSSRPGSVAMNRSMASLRQPAASRGRAAGWGAGRQTRARPPGGSRDVSTARTASRPASSLAAGQWPYGPSRTPPPPQPRCRSPHLALAPASIARPAGRAAQAS